MSLCVYKVLEYTKSELQLKGVAFAIVIRFPNLPRRCVRAYLMSNWEVLIGAESPEEICAVREMISDIEYVNRMDHLFASEYFRHLDELSTGPIRTLASGTCIIEDLQICNPQASEHDLWLIVPQEPFNNLVSSLRNRSSGFEQQ